MYLYAFLCKRFLCISCFTTPDNICHVPTFEFLFLCPIHSLVNKNGIHKFIVLPLNKVASCLNLVHRQSGNVDRCILCRWVGWSMIDYYWWLLCRTLYSFNLIVFISIYSIKKRVILPCKIIMT
jgi:hypothetical protein